MNNAVPGVCKGRRGTPGYLLKSGSRLTWLEVTEG